MNMDEEYSEQSVVNGVENIYTASIAIEPIGRDERAQPSGRDYRELIERRS
jgi:hypothetical protein